MIVSCSTASNLAGFFGLNGSKVPLAISTIASMSSLSNCCTNAGGVAGYYSLSKKVYCRNEDISTCTYSSASN